jgi:Glycosyl hydrolases family 18
MSIINGYWMGYNKTPATNLLNEIPSYVNTVTLFVAAPSPTSGLDTNYLCKEYSATQQQTWVKQLQKQQQKVAMSFMDTPTAHWNNVNVTTFAQTVAQQVIGSSGWGLNGVDVDLESDMDSSVWAKTFINLIKALRTAIGPNAILTADAYTQTQAEMEVLKETKDQLSWVNTMGYFWDTAQMESAAKNYAKVMGGMQKVAIGIGVDYQSGASTPMTEVQALAKYAKQNKAAGMMVFATNNDCPSRNGGLPVWSYCSAINTGLGAATKAAGG